MGKGPGKHSKKRPADGNTGTSRKKKAIEERAERTATQDLDDESEEHRIADKGNITDNKQDDEDSNSKANEVEKEKVSEGSASKGSQDIFSSDEDDDDKESDVG